MKCASEKRVHRRHANSYAISVYALGVPSELLAKQYQFMAHTPTGERTALSPYDELHGRATHARRTRRTRN